MQQRGAEVTGQDPMPLHNKMSYTRLLKVHHFHRVQRPTVLQEGEDINTMMTLQLRRALGLTTRSSMARRSRITVHKFLVLLQARLVLRISHTYLLHISRPVASTNQVTEISRIQCLRPTPLINLHRRRQEHSSSGMAAACLPRSDQTQDCNTRMLPPSCHIDNSHYLLYRLPNLRLRDRPIHRPLLPLPHSRQAGMRSHLLPQHIRNLTPRGSRLLGTQGKEYLVGRLPCTINYLLYPIIHRMVVLAFHHLLSIAGLLVSTNHCHKLREHPDQRHLNIRRGGMTR